MKTIYDDLDFLKLILEHAGVGKADKQDRYFALPRGQFVRVGPADNSGEPIDASRSKTSSLKGAVLRLRGGELIFFESDHPEETTRCFTFSLEKNDV
jgi:hypothetical protein